MKAKVISLIFALLCNLNSTVFASIDRGKEEDFPLKETTFNSKAEALPPAEISKEADNGVCLGVQPLYLDRDISAIKSYSSLPGNIQTTLKQSYLTYEHCKAPKIESLPVNEGMTWCDFSKTFYKYPFVVQTFVETVKAGNPSETPVSVGAEAAISFSNTDFRGKIAYEDKLASSVTGSPALKVALSGLKKLDYSTVPQIKVAAEYNGDQGEKGGTQSVEVARNTIFSPDESNIGVMNLALACSPMRNMFMSVEYYYYLQDRLQVQNFSNNPGALRIASTNGQSQDLGQEFDLRTVLAFTDYVRSELFAGVFNKGKAYANNDDNKTFEIKGEIVVNF